MIMKKNLFWLLTAALVTGLSFTACSDDDDNGGNMTTPDPYDKSTEAAGACFNILSMLSQVGDSLPNDWKTRTFDVYEGKVQDESRPFVRSVVVNSIEDAVNYYSSLTSQELPTSTKSNIWRMDYIGTMEFNALNQNDCYATIDMNLKQLPRIQQLRLVPAAAVNENAAFEGEPYYRLGDVVLDKEDTYWVCVRQCYSPDKIDISYWLSFQIITKTPTNLWSFTDYGMLPQKVLRNLGYQCQAMAYGAQLMAALSRTSDYVGAHPDGILANGAGFGGLKPEALSLEDLQKVAEYWEKEGIWEKIKPSGMSVPAFKAMFNQPLTFIYNTYKKKDNTLTIPVARYNDPRNFFVAAPQYENITVDMKKNSVDLSSYTISATGNISGVGSSALVVRYKNGFNFTGAMAKQLGPTQPINSVTTVYRLAEQ